MTAAAMLAGQGRAGQERAGQEQAPPAPSAAERVHRALDLIREGEPVFAAIEASGADRKQVRAEVKAFGGIYQMAGVPEGDEAALLEVRGKALIEGSEARGPGVLERWRRDQTARQIAAEMNTTPEFVQTVITRQFFTRA